MRSQIACQRCRGNKTRCSNRGPGTDCDTCLKKGATCIYTSGQVTSPSSVVPKRRDSNLAAVQDGLNGRSAEATSKKRKIAPSSNASKGSSSASGDLLNSQLFDRSTWDELFGFFERHFATDLPFLHAQTFIKQLREVDVQALVDPFASLLYAFLALTTPFHSKFVNHSWHGAGRESTPLEIAGLYAEAARSRLRTSNAYSKPSIETTQALFMLGLHEWRTRQGAQCFLTIGTAISCAEFLRCNAQPDLYDDDEACPPAQRNSARSASSNMSSEDQFIQAEIKRRTYWCGFILDSYISTGSGERRRQRIRVDEINIQLPCSQKAFELGKSVRTMMLHQGEEQKDYNNRYFPSGRPAHRDEELAWEGEKDQEGLTWFIKALTVYRGVFHWVCNVTRRREKLCPWDPDSRVCKLKKELKQLKGSLDPDLHLTDRITKYHIRSGATLRSYVQLHAVLALCDMALHREYIAFLPWDQRQPAGPIDGRTLPPPPTEEKTYWKDNASSCFRAARQFNDLARACYDEGVLVETPVVGFAMFYVVQIVIWCRYFGYQDEDNYLSEKQGRDDKLLRENTEKAFSVLFHIQQRLPMARIWCRDAKHYMEELDRLRKEHTGSSPSSNDSSSTNGNYHGAVHWARLDKRLGLTGFGRTEDDALDNDSHGVTDIRYLEHRSEPSSPHAVKSESEDANAGTPISSSFTSVNAPKQSQNGVTPKPIDAHADTHGSSQYPQSYPAQVYGQTYGASSWNGTPAYQPNTYQPTESKERDTLGPSMYPPEMAPVSHSHMTSYNPTPSQFTFPVGWGQDQSANGFGSGNDDVFSNPPIEYMSGFDNSYPNVGNGYSDIQ